MATTYLDWAATAPPMQDIVSDAASIAATNFANPSSAHRAGRSARAVIEQSRDTCAKELNVDTDNVFFTSGGSEANNIILSSFFTRKSKGSLIVTGIEHASVYEPARLVEKAGFDVKYVEAEKDGRVDPDRIVAGIERDTAMVSVMLVNNETGVIQPVSEIVRKIRETEVSDGRHRRRIHIHCDAVQAFGKLPLDVADMDIDSLSASGHKIGAPRGAGLLYLRRQIEPVYRGGGQEGALRPGTENLFAIHALGRTTEVWAEHRSHWYSQASGLRELLLDGIGQISGVRFLPLCHHTPRPHCSPYILLCSFPSIPGEVLVRVMSDRGYAISTGSACSSRGKKNLRVLQQMGIGRDFANSAIRISTGHQTTETECVSFCAALKDAVMSLGANGI